MFKLISISLTIVLSLMICNLSEAATVDTTADYVSAINDLDIGGDYYDVHFVYGSFNSTHPSGFVFGNETAAEQAVVTICGAMTTLAPGYLKVGDTVNAPTEYFYLPFEFATWGSQNVRVRRAQSYGNPWNWDELGDYYPGSNDTWMYAVCSPVPIPGAMLLLGSGLLGIVGIRKKIKK